MEAAGVLSVDAFQKCSSRAEAKHGSFVSHPGSLQPSSYYPSFRMQWRPESWRALDPCHSARTRTLYQHRAIVCIDVELDSCSSTNTVVNN